MKYIKKIFMQWQEMNFLIFGNGIHICFVKKTADFRKFQGGN